MKAPEVVPRDDSRSGGVTLRVVILCVALAFFFGYIIPIIDVKLSNTFLGAQHLPPGAVGALLVLLLIVNPLLRLISRRLVLRRNEILTVYISCLFSCLVPGHGAENFFVSNLIAPFYYATPENNWLTFLSQLKPWLTPALHADGGVYGERGQKLVQHWYEGGGQAVPWSAWLVPVLAWSSLCFALYIMLACLGVMLRAQWAENEALAFPLLRLPLELTEDIDRSDQSGTTGRFFRNPLMWCGFAISASVQLINGLNLYFPFLPRIPMELVTSPYLSELPWNQIGALTLQIYPIAIGLSFLLTREVSFSLWFFFWLARLELVGAYYMGFIPASLPNALGAWGKIFQGYQQVGAFIMYAIMVLWVGREHYCHILRRAFGRATARENESNEMMSYPIAFWGFILSSLFIIGWSAIAGIRVDIAIVIWSLYLVMAICLTRVVVEGGLLFVVQNWTPLGTLAQLTNAGPGHWLASSSIIPAAFIQGAFMTDLRGFLLPSYVQGFKLAHDRKINPRPLLALIAVIIALTFSMSIWMNIRLGYADGGLGFHAWFAKGGAQLPARNIKNMATGVRDVSWLNWFWLFVGMAITYGLMFARSRYLWFPLHPIGYLMTLTYSVYSLWFSILVGWLCKVLIIRFGGNDSYRKVVPLFLGLALGDVSMMLFWLIIDGWQGRTGHWLVPN